MNDQVLYNELYKIANSTSVDTYTEKPMTEVPYPFIYIRGVDTRPQRLKTVTYGQYNAYVEIYANQRQDCTKIAQYLLQYGEEIKTVDTTFHLDIIQTTVRDFKEQLGNQPPVYYFLIELTYKNL